MRRDRKLKRISRLVNSTSYKYSEISNQYHINRGTVISVDGVKFIAERYNSAAAKAIPEEENKFPQQDITITLDK